MCSVSWSKVLKLFIALAGALIGACTLPTTVEAQDEFGFLVIRSAKDPYAYYIWSADCAKINLTDSREQRLQCTLQRNECKPGTCKFDSRSDDQPPLPLVFGISSYNPTCGWVWDPYRRVYVARPC
jgi:hypothetical protein